jgi:hypothetical protein
MGAPSIWVAKTISEVARGQQPLITCCRSPCSHARQPQPLHADRAPEHAFVPKRVACGPDPGLQHGRRENCQRAYGRDDDVP